MTAVHMDPTSSDEVRRTRLYNGDIYLLPPTPQTVALIEWARTLLEEAFAPHEPQKAQYDMEVEKFVEAFAPAKPKFIHHETTRRLLRDVITSSGCDLEETYLDVPRLRGVTAQGYLTAGVGYAHPMHRDTWYSAPMTQLNWWLPIYPFESESSMAFHPNYWSEGVANGSSEFNYYEWNSVGRATAAQHVKTDTRKQPKVTEPVAEDPQVRFVVPPGGIVLFSGAQLHSTVPNTTSLTRFSIDFRTVNIGDVAAKGGAANVDSHCTGTSLRDFRRASDDAAMPEDLVALYDDTPADPAALVYRPPVGAPA